MAGVNPTDEQSRSELTPDRSQQESRNVRQAPEPRQLLTHPTASSAIANFKSKAPNSPYSELLDEVRDQSSIILRVGLAVPFAMEGILSPSQVTFQRDEIATAQQRFIEQFDSTKAKPFSNIPFITVKVDEAGLEKLLQLPEVLTIERIQRYTTMLPESLPIIGADTAYESNLRGSDWNVVVIDTGVDKNHSFLQDKVVYEACFSGIAGFDVQNSLCPNGESIDLSNNSGQACDINISPICAHGTHVAGIVAGHVTVPGVFTGNEQQAGLQGVAPSSGIVSVQVATATGPNCDPNFQSCLGAYDEDIIRALNHIYDVVRFEHPISAVNMSIGKGRYYDYCDDSNYAMTAAIENLRSVGISTIVASGNNGFTDSISMPACISSAIAVGATWDMNTFGPTDHPCPYYWNDSSGEVDKVTCYSNQSSSFDMLLAPGSLITSAVLNNQFESWHGTSMAAPHVAGCFSLIKEIRPAASTSEIMGALKGTGTYIQDWRTPTNTLPRINCFSAAMAVAAFEEWSCEGTCGVAGIDGDVSVPPVDEPVRWVSTNLSYEYIALDDVGGIGTAQNGSKTLSPSFYANKGEILEFYFNYVTSDGASYSDYAWARLLDENDNQESLLFTARTTTDGNTVPGFEMPSPTAIITPSANQIIDGAPIWSPLGNYSGSCYNIGCGYTGWIKAIYTITQPGNYRLEVGVTNWNDTAYDSGMAFTMPYLGLPPRERKRRGLPVWMFIQE